MFSPKNDKSLVANYDARSLKRKQENKKAVCEHFGLKYNPDRPLIAMISRLVEQKGLDLIRAEEWEMMNMPADFVFLGTGDDSYQNLLIWLSNNTANINGNPNVTNGYVNKSKYVANAPIIKNVIGIYFCFSFL